MWGFLALSVLILESVNAQSCCVLSSPESPRDKLSVPEAFRKYGIDGQYVTEPPQDLLRVVLKSDNCNGCKFGPGDVEIYPGDKVTPLFSIPNPEIFYPNAVEGDKYAVILLDLDSPSRDKSGGKAYIHGLFLNSPGNSLLSGDVIVPYVPAAPAVGSDEHRFVGLLYKQQTQLDANTPDMWRLARERRGFSVKDFARKYNLDGPVAGNFFIGEFNACGVYN